jgi:hypothetical protein
MIFLARTVCAEPDHGLTPKEFETSLTVNNRVALKLLALSCQTSSWQKFTSTSFARQMIQSVKDNSEQTFVVSGNSNRLQIKQVGFAIESLSTGGLKATFPGMMVNGNDPCDILIALAARAKVSLLEVLVNKANAISEDGQKGETEYSRNFNIGVAGVSALTAIGALVWLAPPPITAVGALVGIPLLVLSQMVFAKAAGDAASDHRTLRGLEFVEKALNAKSFKVVTCSKESSSFSAKPPGYADVEFVVRKVPSQNRSIQLFLNGQERKLSGFDAAFISQNRLYLLAERCNTDSDRDLLNSKVAELMAAKDLRETDFGKQSTSAEKGDVDRGSGKSFP